MFRLWGKEFKENRLLRDTVICDETTDTRTHKIFNALDAICYEFDLSKPIWLDTTIADFKRHAKARFYQDNFVDSIDFDYPIYLRLLSSADRHLFLTAACFRLSFISDRRKRT